MFVSEEKVKMKKNIHVNDSVPANLTLAAWLSCGLTIVVSTLYITLCSLGIHIRNNCNAGVGDQSDPGSTYFMTSILRLYFKKDDCTHALLITDVTQGQTVFLLVSLTLTVSCACLLLAAGFISVLTSKDYVKYVEPLGYCYVAMVLVSIANDVTTGVHFGMDYNTFTQQIDLSSPGVSVNYARDMYRLGALFLMAVSLKGFVIHIFNMILISLIVVYLVEFRQQVQKQEHSMHKMGALKAFEPPKRNDDPWQNASESTYAPYRPQINPMFVNDEDSPRILNREISRSEYTNPSFDRSYSWHHTQPSLASRPFSYLEDNKRQAPLKAPSPNKEPQWQRDPWDAQAPPVPAPDYSPEAPRRLKSALKSSFM